VKVGPFPGKLPKNPIKKAADS